MTRQLPPIAIVTGTNRGLGKAIVELLCQKQYTVIATQRKFVQQLTNKLCKVEYLDLNDHNSVSYFAQRISTIIPYIDLLVNNAAVCPDIPSEQDTGYWNNVLTINFFSQVHLFKLLYPLLKNSTTFPRVVNISSGDGELVYFSQKLRQDIINLSRLSSIQILVDKVKILIHQILNQLSQNTQDEIIFDGQPAYKLSKALLNCFTQVAARESKILNTLPSVAFISVCPGNVDTDMVDDGVHPISTTDAALRIWPVLDVHTETKTGVFIRDGTQIPW